MEYWDGKVWRNFNGYEHSIITKGQTNQRPSLTPEYSSFQFFDTTLNKPIWWTGEKWVDATGADV